MITIIVHQNISFTLWKQQTHFVLQCVEAGQNVIQKNIGVIIKAMIHKDFKVLRKVPDVISSVKTFKTETNILSEQRTLFA